MRLIHFIIILLFISKSFAQPLSTKAIKVNKVYINNKNQLYFSSVSDVYRSISKKSKEKINKKNGYKDYIAIPVNTFIKLVHNKDTMSIKIICPKYHVDGPESIALKRINFVKGEYIINLYEYIKKINIQNLGYYEIDNFPEDCIAYRKEDDVKK